MTRSNLVSIFLFLVAMIIIVYIVLPEGEEQDLVVERREDENSADNNDPDINNGTSIDPKIIAAGENLYAVWTDNSTGNGDIYFKRIEDNGGNFSRTYNLARNNGTSIDPKIIAAGENLYAVWTDNSTGNGDIYFKRIEDNGGNFSRTYNLARNNGTSIDPKIIAAGENLYAVWTDNSTGNGDIYFKRIEDNGGNFSRTYNLARNNGTSIDPKIIAAGENLYAVWTDNSTGNGDIYFKRIEDNGGNFSRTYNLARNNGTSIDPKIIAAGENLYAVWTDNSTGNGDIYFKRIEDNGGNFSRTYNLARNNGTSIDPKIIAAGENLYAVWTDNSTGNGDIYFKRIEDNGGNFSRTYNLARNNGTSIDPKIIAAGENLYAVWTDNSTGNGDIYFKRIEDNGGNFSRTYNLARNNGTSIDPKIIAAGENLYAVWTDNSTGNGDIYFKRIEDNGGNFSRTYNLDLEGSEDQRFR